MMNATRRELIMQRWNVIQHELLPALRNDVGIRRVDRRLASADLLIRPCEVLSRIANVAVLKVAHDAFGVLLQHRHMITGGLA